jgi:hypothetical protein
MNDDANPVAVDGRQIRNGFAMHPLYQATTDKCVGDVTDCRPTMLSLIIIHFDIDMFNI